jgi:hypothetical protein
MRGKTKEIVGDILSLIVLGTVVGYSLWRFYYGG